jgi:hypothetical protein
MIAQMSVQIILALNIIRMLKLVDSTSLSFVDASRIGSNPFSDKKFLIVIYLPYTLIRPIRPMVKTKLFQCFNKGSNPLWVIHL